MPKPIDLPHLTGLVPYQVEQAIYRLREAIEAHGTTLDDVQAQIANVPAPLSLPEIQQALSPTGDYPLPTAGLLNTVPAASTPGSTTPVTPVEDGLDSPPLPDVFLAIVQSAASAYNITGASSDEDVFNFMRTVCENINNTGLVPPGLTCGFTDAPSSGANVYTCLGETYRYARVTFSNDHTFKLLIDADPGGARTPEWADEGLTPGLYKVSTPPNTAC
jgi:hypothetical protein